jgi:acyl-CoA synthetase (AMP-forming)/AMP-acid ligase II
MLWQGATDPAAPALVDAAGGAVWSHGALRDAVRALASRMGRPQKSLVFCLCRNDPATVIGYLAAIEAGHAVMLLDSAIRGDTLAELLALYRPEIVLASAVTAAADEKLDVEYRPLDLTWDGVARERLDATSGPVHADLGILLPTSGSTGSPKVVRLAGRAMSANAAAIATALAIAPTDRAVSSLLLHYSYGLSVVNSHLAGGACIVLTDRGPLDRGFWDLMRDQRCTSFAGVPYSYQLLERIGFDRFELPSLRTMTQAGGKLDDERVARFHRLMAARGGRFFVMYGQTEATARIAVLPSDLLPRKLGSAGRAIPGGRLEIEVDGVPAELPGVTGEIVYSGPNVMMGYATGRADLSRGDELGGRLHTGDLGYLEADGCLYISGRTKRISKVSGYRVDLDEVEARLAPNGPTAVVGTDEVIVAFCEYGDDDSLQRLRMELSHLLSLHFQAIQFRRVDALPHLPSGKIDYAALEGLAR